MKTCVGLNKKVKIGLVVEGRTEYEAIPELLSRLKIQCARPSCFNGQPREATAETLVEKYLLAHIRVQLAKGADIVVVIIDLENRDCSSDDFRIQLITHIKKQLTRTQGPHAENRVEVVVCNRMFENWLLSDPKGITKSEYIRRDLSKQISCHADGKDALSLIKQAFLKEKSYQKAVHGPRLAKYLRVHDKKVHLCSESLRKFIEIVCSAHSL